MGLIGHFKLEGKKTVCGKTITKTMYVFQSLGHAISGIPSPTGELPCQDCAKILRKK